SFPVRANSAAAVVADANDTDRDAIGKKAREFTDAFNKGNAKAIAGLWTEHGEGLHARGKPVDGRAATEQAYAEIFQNNGAAKIEVLVTTVRFPAKDMAVEEGLLRFTHGTKDLPATSSYVAVHIREGDQWRIALSSESGVGQDRLEDLDWLLGEWTTKMKNENVKLAFVPDPKKPVVTGTFAHTASGKEPVTGSIPISLDPETGHRRSSGVECDGG